MRVGESGDGAAPLVIPNIKAPKNGYAYVYLSNPPVGGQAENNEAVFFDDFKVAHTRGRIIEENHYYAFGLKIAGISSAKFGDENEGSLKNDFLYNDKELWDDADLNWYACPVVCPTGITVLGIMILNLEGSHNWIH